MKHRTLIEMLAFITVALLVIVLYFSGVTVFASDNPDFKPCTHFGVVPCWDESSSEWSQYSYKNNFLVEAGNSNILSYNSLIDQDASITNYPTWSGAIHCDDFTNYAITTDGTYIGDDKSFIAVSTTQQSNRIYLHMPTDFVNSLNENSTFTYINFQGVFNSAYNGSNFKSSLVTIDGEYYLPKGIYYLEVYSSNFAIYPVTGDANSITTLNGLSQINPNYTPAFDESENIRDHRNFNPAFMFINTNTNYGGDGLVTSLGYDKWQTNNLDRYKITWDYSLDFTVASTSDSNTLHFVKNGYSQTLDNIPTGRFAMSLPEIFITMYDGNTNCWNTIKDISMKTIKNDNSFGVAGGVNIGVANFELSSNTPLTLDRAIGITEFKFYVTASITTDDNLDCGSFGYTYDFLDGTYTNTSNFKNQDEVNTTISQYNHDNNLSSGDTGYLDITDYQSNMPASDNYPAVSGGSVSTGGSASAQGGVAYGSNVNNSVIVNTGQDAKEIIKYAKNELFPENYEGGYVEKLETVTDSNNFIQYMSTTFSFMPQTFWNDVAYYGKIALIILVSGFILSLVRKLIN